MRGILLLEVSENRFFGLILKVGMISNPVLSYLVVPPSNPIEERRVAALARQWEVRNKVPMALNLPVFFLQLPYVILNPEKREWIPEGMSFDVWRALSWPFVGMVFWWFAGRGIEALCAALQSMVRPRIGWVETLFAGILVVIGIVALVGMLTSTQDDLHDIGFLG